MEEKMFCFQCQETSHGTGCTVTGMCGKQPPVAAQMDMLMFVCRGISVVTTTMRNNRQSVEKEVDDYLLDALFSTITNANFDEASLSKKLRRGFALRNQLLKEAHRNGIAVPEVDEVEWCESSCRYHGSGHDFSLQECHSEKARQVGVLRTHDEDVRSLKELITYGIKGMAAYMHHARNLKYDDASVNDFIQRALSDITVGEKSIDQLVGLVLETGQYGVKAMALLDKANTETYGHPAITHVSTAVGNRPGILVSGHDLRDLEQLLKQSHASGVDIYTHGEMLPAHYYPLLKKYPHLKGNYGSSWWHQREEFASFNGPILMTTNCIVPPLADAPYRNRLFTTGSTGFPGVCHIVADDNGNKDFSPIIWLAKQCPPPTPIDNTTLVGGFAHNQVVQLADKIVEAVKNGDIRKFVVMAGCDGRMSSRNYYTEFAKLLPNDCVILTAGCAKYRYNKMDLGSVKGIPRVLDAGQCNDSYSLVLTVLHLRDMLHLQDVNQLPIVYNIAWYEQKAVIVLLALLSLGVKNIHLGPTLPAFLSTNVTQVLVKRFGIGTISTPEEDIKKMIQ